MKKGQVKYLFIIGAVVALASVAFAEARPRLEVTEMVLANAMSDGQPVAPVTAFGPAEEWIFCFVRVANRTGAETNIYVGLEQDDGEVQRGRGGIRLRVPASYQYRTFARFPNHGRTAGQYRCVARSERGNVLQHASFQVSE